MGVRARSTSEDECMCSCTTLITSLCQFGTIKNYFITLHLRFNFPTNVWSNLVFENTVFNKEDIYFHTAHTLPELSQLFNSI